MDFEQVEDKIIETLKAEVPYLRAVESYAGQLEGELERLPARFPAAYVVYGGSEFSPVDGPNVEERAEFTVLVAARDLRGRSAARTGDRGAYDMVKDVLAALVNRSFGPETERLAPVRTGLVFAGRSITVYGMDFRTGFDTTYSY